MSRTTTMKTSIASSLSLLGWCCLLWESVRGGQASIKRVEHASLDFHVGSSLRDKRNQPVPKSMSDGESLFPGARMRQKEIKTNSTKVEVERVGAGAAPNPRPRIVGGGFADKGEYPFFGHLNFPGVCGGSLIAPNVILTAAHCFYDELEYVVVGADEYNWISGEEEGNAEHVLIESGAIHPRFNLATELDYDFMLLKLAENIQIDREDQIMKLHPEFELPDIEYTVIGVGRTVPDEGSSAGGRLKELTKVEVPYRICNTDMFPGLINEETMICAGPPDLDGKEDACNGDSGGPLFYYDNDGNPIQIGVVSFGPLESCATEDIAAGYARVSSAKDWIEIMSCEVFGSDYVPLCGDYIPVGAAASTECNTATETLFQFSIKMDDTAADISWELQNTDTGEVVFSDSGFSNREIVFYEGCLSNDVECWSLTINDEGLNPGFCCDGPDASDACCDGWKAGFGIVFGSGSALYFDNPEFEESTVSFDLCQRSYESESTEALVDSTTDDACTDVVITLTTDAWPEETSIVLLGDDFDIDFPFTKFDETETEYTFELCLTGCLRLMVLDDLQDGISPPGGVTITYGGEQVVADLADFAAGRVVEFGSGCPQAEVSFGSTCQDFEVVLSTDDSPEETAIVVLVGDDYNVLVHDSSLQPNTDYGYIECLSGCVTVGILDTVGDGIGSPGFFSASYGDDSTGVITDYGYGNFFRLGDCPDGVSTETSVSAFSGHQIRA